MLTSMLGGSRQCSTAHPSPPSRKTPHWTLLSPTWPRSTRRKAEQQQSWPGSRGLRLDPPTPLLLALSSFCSCRSSSKKLHQPTAVAEAEATSHEPLLCLDLTSKTTGDVNSCNGTSCSKLLTVHNLNAELLLFKETDHASLTPSSWTSKPHTQQPAKKADRKQQSLQEVWHQGASLTFKSKVFSGSGHLVFSTITIKYIQYWV